VDPRGHSVVARSNRGDEVGVPIFDFEVVGGEVAGDDGLEVAGVFEGFGPGACDFGLGAISKKQPLADCQLAHLDPLAARDGPERVDRRADELATVRVVVGVTTAQTSPRAHAARALRPSADALV